MDVKLKKLSIEQFVSALSLEELAELVNGHSGDATVKGVALPGETIQKASPL